jgi:predicted transcriptional regulator
MADPGGSLQGPMARKDRVVMLLSIRPSFAAKLYDGTKRIELRRVRPTRPVTKVLVYETSPVKRITGWFTLRWIRLFSPSRAWSEFRAQLGVTRKAFRSYFRDRRAAVLLAVSRARRFASGVRLSAVRSGMRAPQSFFYLDKELVLAKRLTKTP